MTRIDTDSPHGYASDSIYPCPSAKSVVQDLSFSVVVLTLNEEQNLPGCLESIEWCDDVVILDSHSVDRTIEIARSAGARIFQRAFDDFAAQRNYALEHIPFKHRWVFHLDADERFTRPLLRECQAAIARDRHSCYLVPSKMMFMGRWLRFCGLYPSYQVRLLKRGEVRFVQKGHGQRECDPARGVGRLCEPYVHLCFNKGFEEWFWKHNRYSTQEARASLESNRGQPGSIRRCLGELMRSRDPVVRRRALKELTGWCPCRPTLRFLYMYILRRGFLDGVPGYRYARLLAFYEYMIVLKIQEAQRRQKGLPV